MKQFLTKEKIKFQRIFLLFLFFAHTVFAQNSLDFIKNQSLKNELNDILKLIDESPKTEKVKDSLIFIELIYENIKDMGYPISIVIRTRLNDDYYKIENNIIIKTLDDIHCDSFYFKEVSKNRVLLLNGMKSIVCHEQLKSEPIEDLNYIMKYEFFEQEEKDELGFTILNNTFYYKFIDDKLDICSLTLFDIKTFFEIREGCDIIETKIKDLNTSK
jgi:hypothetical protein